MRISNQSYLSQMAQLSKGLLDKSEKVYLQIQTNTRTQDMAELGRKEIHQFSDAQLQIEKHQNYALNIDVAQSRFDEFEKIFNQFSTILEEVNAALDTAHERTDTSAQLMADLSESYLYEIEQLLNTKIQENFYLFNSRDGRKSDADIRFFEAADGTSFQMLGNVTGVDASANAYALRKVRDAYNGEAIRVERDSDNTQMDIGFDEKGDLDVAALRDFLRGTQGRVVTWYDQGTGGNNLTSGATGPRIELDHYGDKPAIHFDSGTNDILSSGAVTAADPIVSGIVDYTGTGGPVWTGGGNVFLFDASTDTLDYGGGASITNTDFQQQPHLVTQLDGANPDFRVDGSVQNASTTGTPAGNITGFTLGGNTAGTGAEFYTTELYVHSTIPTGTNLLDLEASIQHGSIAGTLETTRYDYANGAPLPSVVTTLAPGTMGAYNHSYSHGVHQDDQTQTYGSYNFDTSDTTTIDVSMSPYEPFIQNLVMGLDVARKSIDTSDPNATNTQDFEDLKTTIETLLDAARIGLLEAKNEINAQNDMLENQKIMHEESVSIYLQIQKDVDDVDSDALAAELLLLKEKIDLSYQTTARMNSLSLFKFV